MNKPAKGEQAWMVGDGIGSMAAAAFLVRDGGWSGADITIFESSPVLGGSLDAAGTPSSGYSNARRSHVDNR